MTERIAHRYVDSGSLPGALTLVWRRGEIAHLGLAGHIDLERGTPMREDAIFRIYSMTKPLTAVGLLMLLEEGRVALDEAVSLPRPRRRTAAFSALEQQLLDRVLGSTV